MRIGSGFIASLALLTAACQTPQQSPAVEASSECARFAVAGLNAMALFKAAGICAAEERKEDANFLMMAGQIRAMADMGVLASAESRDAGAIELFSILYFSMGGLGFDEVYRDPAAVERLAARVEATQINLTSEYDPGWTYSPDSKTDIYDAIALAARQQRVWQMRNYALLMQNDAYYEAHLAHNELQKQNRIFEEGTPAYEESVRLSALMAAAAATVVQHPPPEITLPYARLNEPEADAAFRQIATGANGPSEYSIEVFASREEAAASWLARAYAPAELAALLDSIDFGKEVLAAYSVGRRANAPGKITIYNLEYDNALEGYSFSIRVGVLPESCGVAEADSYPFVLGVVAKGENADFRSSSMSNFPDACGPAASGQPSN